MIRVALIGATGSIGSQILDIIDANPEFKLQSMTAYNNKASLFELSSGRNCKLWHKENSSQELSSIINDPEVDLIVIGVSGEDSYDIYLKAIETGKHIAIASKEAIIRGGCQVIEMAKGRGQKIIPLDSEMVGLKLLLDSLDSSQIKDVTITGSGGPFLNYKSNELSGVSPELAKRHPRWNMGTKISIESALWINKGYEILEAHTLFNIPLEKIKVLIHPESLIHALVTLKNGAHFSQMNYNDMRIPMAIALADLTGGELEFGGAPHLNLSGKKLELLDPSEFPLYKGIALTLSAYKLGIIADFISLSDRLIESFINKDISFTEIYSELDALVSKKSPIESKEVKI